MEKALPAPANPLRVALVSHTNASWTEPYASAILHAGHWIRVFSFSSDPLPGHNVIHLVHGDDPSTGILGWLARSRRLRRLLKEFNPHVVFAPYISSNGMAAALAWPGPLVVSARGGDILKQAGYLPAGPLNRLLVRWVCHRSRIVHAVSAELTDRLRACGVPASKIHTFPLGVTLNRFPPLGDRRPRTELPHIICTRRQEAVYDNATLIAALGLLRHNGTPFRATLAGDGPLLASLRRQASDLGLEAMTCIPGEATLAQIDGWLQTADVYVSASTSDGASSSLLEALASGAFPVVSDITANRNWVEPGQTGLLFRPGDPQDLALKLRVALQDQGLREKAAVLNRASMESGADRNRLNHRLLHLLIQAASMP